MNYKTISLAVICLLTAIMAVFAQVTNSDTLTGKVTALSGTPVPNASVAVTNTANNESKRVLTAQNGTFTISGLAPGTYTLVVEIAGFKRTALQNLTISTTSNAPVNIALEAGSAAETVELTGESPATQTHTGEIAAGLDMREIDELPIVDRNNQQLTELQSGITPPGPALGAVTDPERNRYFSATGQAPIFNMFSVDGMVNWEPYRGSEVHIQPDEFLQQKDVITSNYVEGHGYSGGAVVQDMSRAGADNWHGEPLNSGMEAFSIPVVLSMY